MKEYIAETGGRYTYSDDILNLQELALSMTALFSECSNFIISGCGVEGAELSAGYVWIGGKVRYFSGATGVTFPYYIYERNSNESVVYANEINKLGRTCYQCMGGNSVLQSIDPVTGQIPDFIEMTKEFSPRLIDKFFGRYALLLDSVSQRQRVKKDITFEGDITVEKGLRSNKETAVYHKSNGYNKRSKVKEDGTVSVGMYLNELLTSEIMMGTDGSFSFRKGDKELAKITDNGFVCDTAALKNMRVGSVYINQGHITNTVDDTDDGSININFTGYNQETSRFRNFNVYDGKRCSIPLFQVEGKTKTISVNGLLRVNGKEVVLYNSAFAKGDAKLTGAFHWQDSKKETIASIGYLSTTTFDLAVNNLLGNIVFTPNGYVNVAGELRIKGIDIYSVFVTQTTFTGEMKKKVNVVDGKQLSTEDFTTDYREKLDAISGSNIEGGGVGYVTADDVAKALRMKISANENLLDVMDKAAARVNLSVYSKGEADIKYLTIAGKLAELVALNADEINGMTQEQASALKAEKQAAVRANIDAEKRGTGELKLSKALNLSDLTDKTQARHNISVYSTTEIDEMLAGKLGSDGAYQGAVFTETLKKKLEDIKYGNFTYIDNEGTSHAQAEGFVSTSQVIKELAKKANWMLDGYNSSQKDMIAENIGIYTKTVSDSKYAAVESVFQDYITHLVKKGKTTAEAQQILRDKFDVLSKKEVTDTYLRKDGKLSDLAMPNVDAKKLACRNIGAAYADDYQPKLLDTGWLQMINSGSGTDTRNLFIRQIGNIVSIQGVINTARRDGSNQGGVIAVIPNQVQPPKYGLRNAIANFNDDHKYNRGCSFIIWGGSRTINIYESGMYNADTEINFTYFV